MNANILEINNQQMVGVNVNGGLVISPGYLRYHEFPKCVSRHELDTKASVSASAVEELTPA